MDLERGTNVEHAVAAWMASPLALHGQGVVGHGHYNRCVYTTRVLRSLHGKVSILQQPFAMLEKDAQI